MSNKKRDKQSREAEKQVSKEAGNSKKQRNTEAGKSGKTRKSGEAERQHSGEAEK